MYGAGCKALLLYWEGLRSAPLRRLKLTNLVWASFLRNTMYLAICTKNKGNMNLCKIHGNVFLTVVIALAYTVKTAGGGKRWKRRWRAGSKRLKLRYWNPGNRADTAKRFGHKVCCATCDAFTVFCSEATQYSKVCAKKQRECNKLQDIRRVFSRFRRIPAICWKYPHKKPNFNLCFSRPSFSAVAAVQSQSCRKLQPKSFCAKASFRSLGQSTRDNTLETCSKVNAAQMQIIANKQL